MCPYILQTRDWIDLVSIFSTPVISIVTALFASYIAWRQFQTAKNKLKLDLFDKRYAVFEKITGFIASPIINDNLKSKDIVNYLRDINSAKFLFEDNKDVINYLDMLREKATELIILKQNESEALGKGDPDGNQQKQTDLILWFEAQLNEIDDIFKKYLVLKH